MFMTFEKISVQNHDGSKHQAPMDCQSKDGARCDICFAPMPVVEHPAARAARMIKELHQQNLKMMDDGHVFIRDNVNVNEEMRAASLEQIEHCDRIIERASKMDPSLYQKSQLVLEALETKIDEAKQEGDVLTAGVPEIGNYDHDEK